MQASQTKTLEAACGTATGSRPSILVVDDHPGFRCGVVEMIREMGDVGICGEVGDGESALEAMRRLHPDLVLTDVNLPGPDGIEITRVTKAEAPETAVLVVSSYDEAIYGVKALRAGASGYVCKDNAFEDLVPAIRQALRHEIFASPRLMSFFFLYLSRVVPPDFRADMEEAFAANDMNRLYSMANALNNEAQEGDPNQFATR